MSAQRHPSLEVVYSRSERVLGRPISGDYVLVPIVDRAADADGIYDLNPPAAFIWEQFDGSRDGHAIVAGLTERYDVDPARAGEDFLQFVETLLSIGAIMEETAPTKISHPREER
jgi:hypothetical protein